MATVERIDLLDHSVEPPELIASFFWSEASGLTCTSDYLLQEIEQHGIPVPPEGAPVFPRAGRACFLALKWRGSSFIQVTEPRVVSPS